LIILYQIYQKVILIQISKNINYLTLLLVCTLSFSCGNRDVIINKEPTWSRLQCDTILIQDNYDMCCSNFFDLRKKECPCILTKKVIFLYFYQGFNSDHISVYSNSVNFFKKRIETTPYDEYPNTELKLNRDQMDRDTQPVIDLINAIPDLNDDSQPVQIILKPREVIESQYRNSTNGNTKYQGVEHIYNGGNLNDIIVTPQNN